MSTLAGRWGRVLETTVANEGREGVREGGMEGGKEKRRKGGRERGGREGRRKGNRKIVINGTDQKMSYGLMTDNERCTRAYLDHV